jgi:SAM-dependent methyltransferase
MSFTKINRFQSPKCLYEVEQAACEEPVDVYKARYSVPLEELSPIVYEDLQRHQSEIIQYMEEDSSLLVFGAGHSVHCNTYLQMPNIKSVVAVDYVQESALWLKKEIQFFQTDILSEDLPVSCDYVLTSHTIEHFTRVQILYTALPKLLAAAQKALVVIVPYADNWADEPSHRCRFYEDDEFAFLADKYKFMRNNQEIVFWFDKEV